MSRNKTTRSTQLKLQQEKTHNLMLIQRGSQTQEPLAMLLLTTQIYSANL